MNEDNSRQHNRCRLCKIKDYMNQFECMLFMKEMDRGGVRTEGTENPSIEMIVLKSKSIPYIIFFNISLNIAIPYSLLHIHYE